MASQLYTIRKRPHLVDQYREKGERSPSAYIGAEWPDEYGMSSNESSPVDSVISCKNGKPGKLRQCRETALKEARRGDLDVLADQAYQSLKIAHPSHDSKPMSLKMERPLAVGYSYNVVAPNTATSKPWSDRPSRDLPTQGSRNGAKACPPLRYDSLARDGRFRGRMNSIPDVEDENLEDLEQVPKRTDSATAFTELNEATLPTAEKAAEVDEMYHRAVLRTCKQGKSGNRATSQPPKPISPWAHPSCPPDPLYHPEIARGLGLDLGSLQSRPKTPPISAKSSQLSLSKSSEEDGVPEYIKQLEAHGLLDKKDLRHWNGRRKSSGGSKTESKPSRTGKGTGNALRSLLKKPHAGSVRSLSLS